MSICPKCSSDKTYQEDKIAKNGIKHIGLYCAACGTWIKWMPQGGPVKIYFGKYKGQNLEDVPAAYLMWLYENTDCYGAVKKYIEENMAGIKKQIEDGNGNQ